MQRLKRSLKRMRSPLLVLVIAAVMAATGGYDALANGFCSRSPLGQGQCEAARNLLRGLLPQKPQDNLVETDPLPLESEKQQQPDATAVLPNQQTPVETNIIYIPFPTPRPNFLPSSETLNRSAVLIDPITTESVSSKCLDPRKVKDRDIRQQAQLLKKDRFCITRQVVNENRFDWQIYTIKNTTHKSGPHFVVPHDNEDSAFKAGVYGVNKYGGTLVVVEANDERFFKGQDPNRNFGTSSTTANRCKFQKLPAPRFTKAMLKDRKRGQPIIALHSNANGFAGNGGSGTVSIKRKSKNTMPFVSAISRSRRFKDEDTLIILASKKPVDRDRKLRRKVEHFTKNEGINVLVEQVTRKNNDCSLSNYVTLKRLGTYFNIEVETDDTSTQRKILDRVMAYVRS